MSVTHLPMWEITPIEIALDVEPPRIQDASGAVFSGTGESRVCLVAAFALSSQLKRVVAAVERVIPLHLPRGLQVAPPPARGVTGPQTGAAAIGPMLPLLRLQQRLIRAIEPGLAARTVTEDRDEMSEQAARFIRDFIPSKALPVYEPALSLSDFEPTRLKPVGITLYHLGHQGKPQSIVARWAYAQNARGSVHLKGGP